MSVKSLPRPKKKKKEGCLEYVLTVEEERE